MNKQQHQVINIDKTKSLGLLKKFIEPGPYYTSYPSLSAWTNKYNSETYVNALRDFYKENGHDVPIHLYVHIPFCAKLLEVILLCHSEFSLATSVILIDNVLWSGKVLEPATEKDFDTQVLQELNDLVAKDSRCEKVLLPLRDGLMMIRVKK